MTTTSKTLEQRMREDINTCIGQKYSEFGKDYDGKWWKLCFYFNISNQRQPIICQYLAIPIEIKKEVSNGFYHYIEFYRCNCK